jgi:glycosyltransferase involved in cell wall biosynthesis
MLTLLLIDSVCPKPYLIDDLEHTSMGGTEATVIRVAKGFSHRYNVIIAQRGRKESTKDAHGVTYTAIGASIGIKPDVVVTLRDARSYREAKDLYPDASHYLWLHDVASGDYQKHLEQCLEGHPTNIITVSNWHKNQVMNALPNETLKGNLKATVIYNPIAEYCSKDLLTKINPKQLIFTSSPHKGLDQVLELFSLLRKKDPEFTLSVANPGYYPDYKSFPEGVISLSGTPHKELMKLVRSSLCVFYPQNVFEETFGIVYAEANAVGTPVLAVNIGAASEVLENNHQIVPKKVDVILDTVQAWSRGERPTVSVNKAFTLPEVLKTWNKLIRVGNVG